MLRRILSRPVTRLNHWLNPPRDYNIPFAQYLGNQLTELTKVPPLAKPATSGYYYENLVTIIFGVDTHITNLCYHDIRERYLFLRSMSCGLLQYWPNISELDACGVALRLWSGCLSGAKIMAYRTRSGINQQKDLRKRWKMVTELARKDPIYKEGVSVCVLFKETRKERCDIKEAPSWVIRKG